MSFETAKVAQYHRRLRPLLGTFVEIGLLAESPLSDGFDMGFEKINRVQKLMSFHAQDSELSRLNRSPHTWQTLSRETHQLLAHAKALGQATNERFNVTVGGHLVNQGLLPKHIQHTFLSHGQSDDIELNETQARLKRPVLITLDGIAKGFAVDFAVDALLKAGYESGWINAGGDVRVFGEKTLPVRIRGQHDTYHLTRKAMATSQVGLQASEAFPAQIIHTTPTDQAFAGLITVVADQTYLADALTKVFGSVSPEAERSFTQNFHVKVFRHPITSKI